ncbi:DNA-binding response regulator, OmpR family, contains REC and winged-helix (wHTH) domain [Haladaptatus litoreus]|uniref:DNA-binding response regulator, OmpR family, contains REC and winged-helix (WHTH) domain n=1 Tax=Haladaptatus litoreus TaxID=553468 RepID=A0A1N7E1J4_9EURY|nr:HalX domain-containing protein [Haladaptatus litoreus]SIR81977.1 DNA-binding response regulator, OmpR family, contains REC and winged-helix (wHTH) domain [Haladaptatus litoreus]
MAADEPTILVVDDEKDVTDLYATWLEDSFDVRRAYEGHEALNLLDNEVNVVLLDRRMPGLSGDEVLAELRNRDLRSRVVMVTAVKPDFDIIEMGFDDYLVKPVSKDDLYTTVEGMLTRVEYDDQMQKYFSLVSKKAVLETEKSEEELADNDEYRRLESKVETLRNSVDDARETLSNHDDFVGAFQDLT